MTSTTVLISSDDLTLQTRSASGGKLYDQKKSALLTETKKKAQYEIMTHTGYTYTKIDTSEYEWDDVTRQYLVKKKKRTVNGIDEWYRPEKTFRYDEKVSENIKVEFPSIAFKMPAWESTSVYAAQPPQQANAVQGSGSTELSDSYVSSLAAFVSGPVTMFLSTSGIGYIEAKSDVSIGYSGYWYRNALPEVAKTKVFRFKKVGTLLFGIADNSTEYFTSVNGKIWKQNVSPISLDRLYFSRGKYIAYTFAGDYASSTDGLTFTKDSSKNISGLVGVYAGQIGDKDIEIHLTHPSRVPIVYIDGVVKPATGVLTQQSQFFGSSSRIIATSIGMSSGQCMTTTDGITWSSMLIPGATDYQFGLTHYSPALGLYLITVGYERNSSGSEHDVYYTSPDGLTWTKRTFPKKFQQSSIDEKNGVLYITNSQSPEMLTSTDGISWTTETTPSIPSTGGWRSIVVT